MIGVDISAPQEQYPYNPQNTEYSFKTGNSTDCTDITPRGLNVAEPAPARSVRDDRLREFCFSVRSFGVDQGVRLDNYVITEWLPEPDRERVQDGELGRKERSRMAHHLALRMVTARGIVPDCWDVVCLCEQCGPVWAPESSAANVSTCIWCDLRKARKWFPRPWMQCGQCRHLTRDRINPAGGLGSCGKGHDSEWLSFPHSEWPCADWREV